MTVEHADEVEVALRRAEDVVVVLVERVDRARPDLEGRSRGNIHHFAFTGNAVVGLEVVLVLEAALRAFQDPRLVNGVAHAVVSDDHSFAVPSGPGNVASGVGDVFGANDDHGPTLLRTSSRSGGRGGARMTH